MRCFDLSEKKRYYEEYEVHTELYFISNIKYIEYKVYINYNLYNLCFL